MNNNRIALNIIIKNEEKFLPGCLESVKDLVDEIVLADTGSDDRSVEIASSYTDKILFFKWNNNFSEARNFVKNNSDSEWILYLDADERIDSKYHTHIKSLVQNPDVDAYQLKIKSVIKDGSSEQIHIVPYPRLFRNLPDIKFEGKIHEQITPSLVKAGAKFESTDIVIDHLGYAQNDEILLAKKKRNLEALIEQVKNEPNNAYALFQLGQNYIALGDTEAGIKHLSDALKLNSLTNPVKATTLTALAKYQYDHKNTKNAIELCSLSLAIAPNQLFGRLLLSEILFSQKKCDESIKFLKEAFLLAIEPEDTRRIDVATDVSYEPAFIKYLIGQRYQACGQLEDAISAYKEAIKLKPAFNEALLELAGILFFYKKFDSAEKYLNRINLSRLSNIPALLNMAGLYEEMKKNNECRRVLERVVTLDNSNAKALFFLGNCYLYDSDLDSAEKYFLHSLSLSPEVPETIMNLAYISIKKNKYSQALEYYKILSGFDPNNEEIIRKIAALEVKILMSQTNIDQK